jgi:hypothetical protein
MADPITFVVPGVEAAALTRGAGAAPTLDVPPAVGTLDRSVVVTAQRAGGENLVRLTAQPGTHAVVLQIGNGPDLWLSPETARDLLRSQRDPLTPRGPVPSLNENNEVFVPRHAGSLATCSFAPCTS